MLQRAQTAILYPNGLVDADGRSLAEGFPRVYNVIAGEVRNNVRVAGSGSGGLISLPSTFLRLSLAA
jgi:hypothetical protein